MSTVTTEINRRRIRADLDTLRSCDADISNAPVRISKNCRQGSCTLILSLWNLENVVQPYTRDKPCGYQRIEHPTTKVFSER